MVVRVEHIVARSAVSKKDASKSYKYCLSYTPNIVHKSRSCTTVSAFRHAVFVISEMTISGTNRSGTVTLGLMSWAMSEHAVRVVYVAKVIVHS